MKVTYKQLKAIIKLMTTMAELDQFEESEIQNIARFLDEFKLDHDKVKELLYSADQMELEEAPCWSIKTSLFCRRSPRI